jgi:hypothetical protein
MINKNGQIVGTDRVKGKTMMANVGYQIAKLLGHSEENASQITGFIYLIIIFYL